MDVQLPFFIKKVSSPYSKIIAFIFNFLFGIEYKAKFLKQILVLNNLNRAIKIKRSGLS